MVLAPDLLGRGELGPGSLQGDAYNFKMGQACYHIWFASIQIARSLVGIQAGDVSRLIDFMKNNYEFSASEVSIVATGEMCPVALHVAIFDERVLKLALVEPLLSYASLVSNCFYKPSLILSSVAGALTGYDLPDLYAAMCPRKLLLINITDQNGRPASQDLLEQELSIVKGAFASQKAEGKLKI